MCVSDVTVCDEISACYMCVLINACGVAIGNLGFSKTCLVILPATKLMVLCDFVVIQFYVHAYVRVRVFLFQGRAVSKMSFGCSPGVGGRLVLDFYRRRGGRCRRLRNKSSSQE